MNNTSVATRAAQHRLETSQERTPLATALPKRSLGAANPRSLILLAGLSVFVAVGSAWLLNTGEKAGDAGISAKSPNRNDTTGTTTVTSSDSRSEIITAEIPLQPALEQSNAPQQAVAATSLFRNFAEAVTSGTAPAPEKITEIFEMLLRDPKIVSKKVGADGSILIEFQQPNGIAVKANITMNGELVEKVAFTANITSDQGPSLGLSKECQVTLALDNSSQGVTKASSVVQTAPEDYDSFTRYFGVDATPRTFGYFLSYTGGQPTLFSQANIVATATVEKGEKVLKHSSVSVDPQYGFKPAIYEPLVGVAGAVIK
jgi:hypothetical protein